MIVGKLVERTCATSCCRLLRDHAATSFSCTTAEDFKTCCRCGIVAEHGASAQFACAMSLAAKIFWDDDLYRGDAYPGYAWAVYVAEVAVDLNTYMATVHAL